MTPRTAIAYAVGVALFGWVGAAQADVVCESAEIVRAGVVEEMATTPSRYYVEATCDDATKWRGVRQFYLSSDLGDSGYATALTALSEGKKVGMQLDGNDWGSLVEVLELRSDP